MATPQVSTSAYITDRAGNTPIRAYYAKGERLVSVTVGSGSQSIHLMFDADAFERFRAALAEVVVPSVISPAAEVVHHMLARSVTAESGLERLMRDPIKHGGWK